MDFLLSFGKGLLLGGGLCVLGIILDNTVCSESLNKMGDYELYNQGIQTVKTNMMVIGPLFYGLVDQFLLSHDSVTIQWINILGMLGIHSICYYMVHFGMHKYALLIPIHNFHHKFDTILVPSIGNAVSKEEFFLAYMGPFIFGAYVLKPNEISFVIPIGIIGLLNLMIHCQELEYVPFVKWWVSPKNHIEHHRIRYKHYAAPTLNLDYLLGERSRSGI